MLQHLGHVLADLAQRDAAAARARRWRRMHEALARQIRRQRPPRRPLAFEGFHLDDFGRCRQFGLRLCLRCFRFQVGELKLKLL